MVEPFIFRIPDQPERNIYAHWRAYCDHAHVAMQFFDRWHLSGVYNFRCWVRRAR